ncbi:MAG: hypothetical protein Q9161_005407 [Pseudevernia consocians]
MDACMASVGDASPMLLVQRSTVGRNNFYTIFICAGSKGNIFQPDVAIYHEIQALADTTSNTMWQQRRLTWNLGPLYSITDLIMMDTMFLSALLAIAQQEQSYTVYSPVAPGFLNLWVACFQSQTQNWQYPSSGSGEFEPLTIAPQGDQSAGQPISLVGQLAAEWSVWFVFRPLVSRLLKAVAPFGAMGIPSRRGRRLRLLGSPWAAASLGLALPRMVNSPAKVDSCFRAVETILSMAGSIAPATTGENSLHISNDEVLYVDDTMTRPISNEDQEPKLAMSEPGRKENSFESRKELIEQWGSTMTAEGGFGTVGQSQGA